MAQLNLMCESESCYKTAKVFGLNGTLKPRRCEDHMSSLLTKTTQFFDISAYYFISNVQDAAEFDRRKPMKEKGCGNLTVLETNCEKELNAALIAIEFAKNSVIRSVESRFEEMKAAVTMACADAKAQFAQLQTEFQQFLTSKNSQLSPTAELVCGDLAIVPAVLRFGLADPSSHISAALSHSWKLCTVDVESTLRSLDARQKDSVIDGALAEATKFAQKGIKDALRCVDLLIADGEGYDQRKNNVILEVLQAEKTEIGLGFAWMQHSWELRQRCKILNESTFELGQQLAKCLYHHGRFPEAEEVLRSCYDVAQKPELSMSVCNDISAVYSASAQDQQAHQLCVWVLETFAASNCPAEHYWAALLYLVVSTRLQSKHRAAKVLLEDWLKRGLRETALAQMLRLIACGIGTASEKESEKCLLQARRIGTSHFPTSTFTALGLHFLAFVTADSTRKEQFYREAQAIYDTSAPKSVYAAYNLRELGYLLERRMKLSEAEQCWKQAESIWEVAAPKSEGAGFNFLNLGRLLEATEQTEQSIQKYKRAATIFAEVGYASLQSKAEKKIARLRS